MDSMVMKNVNKENMVVIVMALKDAERKQYFMNHYTI